MRAHRSSTAAATPTIGDDVSGWRLAYALARFLPARYIAGGLLWVLVLSVPALSGLVLHAFFDRVTDGQAATLGWLLALYFGIDLVGQGVRWLANACWPRWWTGLQTLMRTNMLRSLLAGRGAASTRLPASSGEALNRFRDDVEDLVLLTDITVDLAGDVTFAAIALAVMFSIDPTATLVIALPLIAAVVATRKLSDRIRRTHSAARHAAAEVSEQLGGLFHGVLSLKVAGAETAAIDRLRRQNAGRRVLEVKARLLTDLLDALTASTVELSTGLVLLLVAPRMRDGSFTVGDLALFVAYLGPLANLPRRIGRILYRQEQARVAGSRMRRLLTKDETVDDLVAHHPDHLIDPAPPAPVPVRTAADRLEVLEIDGLTMRHRGTERGIEDVTLRIERGTFVVVTGAVGSGKTTLLRALLGLVPADGCIRWNGMVVEDPGSFLVPPRAAYAAQVPRLWSAALEENIVLGWSAGAEAVDHALRLACLDADVTTMPSGMATLVGPRGVRLSGGQLQRATAARALVRDPELLVV